MRRKPQIIFILLFFIGVRFGYSQIPTITNFAPVSGPIGTSVQLTGTNFSTTPANNIVYFGATQATVAASTTTELTVTVPTGTTYQPISVTAGGLTAFSSQPFMVTFAGGGIDINSFSAKVDFGPAWYSSAVGDLDGDGKPDLAAPTDNNTVSVFKNTSTPGAINGSSFVADIDFATGSRPWRVSMGDLDGDGKLDLAVRNIGDNTVSIFLNTSIKGTISASSFGAKVDFITGNNPNDIVMGDLDGDGKPELVVSNYDDNTVSVFRNTSTMGAITASSFEAKVDFVTGIGPSGIAIGDLDGDGKPELAVANYSNNTVSIFRNSSTPGTIAAGSLAARIDLTTGLSPYDIAIGDLNGDGKLDLVVTNNSRTTISVLRNSSPTGTITEGSFQPKVDFATGSRPYACGIAISDLDGDGKPDLAVSNYWDNRVSVFNNISTPGAITEDSFAAKVDFETANNPLDVAIGDLDGDGRPDLAVTTQAGRVSILRNLACLRPTKPTLLVNASNPSAPVLTSSSTNGNQWYLSGKLLPGETNQSITATVDGFYKVTVTQNNCPSLFSEGFAWHDIVDTFIARSFTLYGLRLPYRLFIPANYSATKKYPLVLALHGSGESGIDNNLQISSSRLATSWADPVNQANYPCFVLAPQTDSGWDNDPVMGTISTLLDSLSNEFSIDSNRLYVTGLSMGGFGTWDIITRFPNRFAAAVPMSGGWYPGSVTAETHTPIWNFHGALDLTVPVGNSRDMIEALRSIGHIAVYTNCHLTNCYGLPDSTIEMYIKSHADLIYTEYQFGGHGIWDESYNNPLLHLWVFDQYRSMPGAIAITNLNDHQTLKGIQTVQWLSPSAGDSVEIWYSPNAGATWRVVSRSEPDIGSYAWDTRNFKDGAFELLNVFLKNKEGFIYSRDQSAYFTTDNGVDGTPFVKITNVEYPIIENQPDLNLRLLFGESKRAPLTVRLYYSPDGGQHFNQFDSYTMIPDTIPVIRPRRVGLAALEDSDNAVIKVEVDNGKKTAADLTPPFYNKTGAILGIASKVPDGFALGQNYPNPCSQGTIIPFSLPRATLVTVTLFNTLGEETATLVSGQFDAGTYTKQWNTSDLERGMYFYRLRAGNYTETRKLILIR